IRFDDKTLDIRRHQQHTDDINRDWKRDSDQQQAEAPHRKRVNEQDNRGDDQRNTDEQQRRKRVVSFRVSHSGNGRMVFPEEREAREIRAPAYHEQKERKRATDTAKRSS